MVDLNKDIYDDTVKRIDFFRSVQVLPKRKDLNEKGWLSNFEEGTERNIACHLLDYFMYYPKDMIDQMLITAVGRSAYELSTSLRSWSHSDFKNKCFYSFIPGENPNPTDSGHIFTRKLRDTLNIPEERILNYNEIHTKLQVNTIEPHTIILVDDFVGSGSQCYTAWCQNTAGPESITLKETIIRYNHKLVYAPLIINNKGLDIIKKHCSGLILSPAHILGPEYNLFNPNCICWKGDPNLYKTGLNLILQKSAQLDIPFTDGKSVKDAKGFGEQGLAISFEHGTPDATLPLFYWSDNWVPLIQKVYER